MKLIYYNQDGTIRGIEDGDYIDRNTVVKTIVLDYPDSKQLEGMDMTTNPPTPILIDKPIIETEIAKLQKEIEELKAYKKDLEELQASQNDQDDVLDYLLGGDE